MTIKKDIFKILLEKEDYEGFYALSNGDVLYAFETYNDLEYDDSIGGVYYSIYSDGEEVDGGLMEYTAGDTLATFNDFVVGYHGVSITGPIAMSNDPNFGDLEDAVDDPDEFCAVLNRIKMSKGSKNIRPEKKYAERRARFGLDKMVKAPAKKGTMGRR